MSHKKSQNRTHCSDSKITMGNKLAPAFRARILEERSKNVSISGIAKKLSINRKTVYRWLSGNQPKPRPVGDLKKFLRANEEDVRSLFIKSNMNCAVVRQLLSEEKNVDVPLRMLERFLKRFRSGVQENEKTCRFETKPGQQMQIDFCEKDVLIDGSYRRMHFFVGVLGFSRRCFVKAYWVENQEAWLDGTESALHEFGGVPVWIVCDNTKSLIADYRARGDEKFSERVKYFSNYYMTGFVSTAPYKPRSKGKVERMVRYVKGNALAGREFRNINELNKWLEVWACQVAGQRKLRDFEPPLDTPMSRFEIEKERLLGVGLRPKIFQVKFEVRKADEKARIQVDNQKFDLPDNFANQIVQIQMGYRCISVTAAGINRHINLNRAKALYLKDDDKWTHLSQKHRSLPSVESVKAQRNSENTMLPTPSHLRSSSTYDRLFGIPVPGKSKDEGKRETSDGSKSK